MTSAYGNEFAGSDKVADGCEREGVRRVHASVMSDAPRPDEAEGTAVTQSHANVGGTVGKEGSIEPEPSSVSTSAMPLACSEPPAMMATSGSRGGVMSCVTVVLSPLVASVTARTRVVVAAALRVFAGSTSVGVVPRVVTVPSEPGSRETTSDH